LAEAVPKAAKKVVEMCIQAYDWYAHSSPVVEICDATLFYNKVGCAPTIQIERYGVCTFRRFCLMILKSANIVMDIERENLLDIVVDSQLSGSKRAF
jgi:hypothetical protein